MPENQRVSAVIEGFYFENEQEIERAKQEIEGIAYIRSHTDMKNPETVLQLYRKLTEEHIFETTVGMVFLKELWDYLAGIPGMEGQELLPIRISEEKISEKQTDKMSVREKTLDKKNGSEKTLKQVRKNLKISLLLNLFLLILVVGMVIISMSGNNLNIMNYENKIINKYADWEQELKQRETEVKSREQELGIAP